MPITIYCCIWSSFLGAGSAAFTIIINVFHKFHCIQNKTRQYKDIVKDTIGGQIITESQVKNSLWCTKLLNGVLIEMNIHLNKMHKTYYITYILLHTKYICVYTIHRICVWHKFINDNESNTYSCYYICLYVSVMISSLRVFLV